MMIRNLPSDATEETVTELFSNYGTVRSINVAMDIFTGKCRGFGFVEMEGHEARSAVAGLNGKTLGERPLRVVFEDRRKPRGRRGRRF